MTVRVLIFLLGGILSASAGDMNAIILRQVAGMPRGGGYSVTSTAHQALRSSCAISSGRVDIVPERAQPSYCSGATYLVLLKTLAALEEAGALSLGPGTWQALRPDPMPDGHGVWGRWNANGPGTARLFYELGLGRNFTSYADARPGDFMKIFWTSEVGANERGHSVIYLGTETKDGVEYVRYWSSNKPGGFGEKSVAKSKIARALFSRLEAPQRFAGWQTLPEKDRYLASLLTTESSFPEVVRVTGAR